MVCKTGDYLGGVRDLEDLRKRCRIDEYTNCWLWSMGCDKEDGIPRVWVTMGDGKRRVMRGRKAAIYLSTGRDLPPWHRAFPRLTCKSKTCVNPGHSRTGTLAEWGEYIAATGKGKSHAKTAANRKTSRTRLAKITLDQAREIRLSDESTYALAAKYGIAQSAIWNIKRGRSWKEHAVGASVFTLAYQEVA
jgi:hypothetical protein